MGETKAIAVAALVLAGAVVRIEIGRRNRGEADLFWIGHLEAIAAVLCPTPAKGKRI